MLVLGYGASQLAYWRGPEEAFEWHLGRADTPQIAALALLLFFGCVALALVPEKTEDSE